MAAVAEHRVDDLRASLQKAQLELAAAHARLLDAVRAAAEARGDIESSTPPNPKPGPKRRGLSRKVLTLLRETVDRDWSADEVAEALGVPDKAPSIRTALGRLVVDGQAYRTAPGRFQSAMGPHAEVEYDGEPEDDSLDDDLDELERGAAV